MSATPTPDVAMVTVRDGVEIGVAIYAPKGGGRFPALFAASPYRFDNNILPASPQFLWRETRPIEFYVQQGYAYVHMDVRGSGLNLWHFEHDLIPYALETDWPVGAAGFEPLHSRSEFAKTLRSGRENSNMRISIEGCRAAPQTKSQGMTDTSRSDFEMQRFESTRPKRTVCL